MHKRNWNKINKVSVRFVKTEWDYSKGSNGLRTKSTTKWFEYDTLYDAVKKHHYAWKHSDIYRNVIYNRTDFFDEMGMKIPDWKIDELSTTIPSPYYGRRRNFKFRNGPVEYTGSHYRWRGCRHVRTTQEIRENEFLAYDEDAIEYNIKARDRRKQYNLPTWWDDRPRHREQNWKRQRKTQWKVKN